METPLIRRFIRLAAGDATSKDRLAGRTVRVRRGRVWLTQHADLRDYFLQRGEEVRIANAGAVVIHALADAVVEVRADERPLPPDLRVAIARLVRRFRAAFVPAHPH